MLVTALYDTYSLYNIQFTFVYYHVCTGVYASMHVYMDECMLVVRTALIRLDFFEANVESRERIVRGFEKETI